MLSPLPFPAPDPCGECETECSVGEMNHLFLFRYLHSYSFNELTCLPLTWETKWKSFSWWPTVTAKQLRKHLRRSTHLIFGSGYVLLLLCMLCSTFLKGQGTVWEWGHGSVSCHLCYMLGIPSVGNIVSWHGLPSKSFLWGSSLVGMARRTQHWNAVSFLS